MCTTPEEEESVIEKIDRSLTHSTEKQCLESLRALPEGKRAVFSTWIVQCEVENGGFAQYFWNIEEEGFYDEANHGFKTIKADIHLAIFIEALDVIRPYLSQMHTMQGPKDRFEIYKPMLIKEGLADKLWALDNRFYETKPSLSEIRCRYIQPHPEIT